MRALVDAAYAGRWVAVPEGDEDPDQLAFAVAGKLQHERVRALGRRRVDARQVELCAAGEFGRVRAD